MVVLKSKDIAKMSKDEREEKIKELKMELLKNRLTSSKGGKLKTRELKKAIARFHTFNRLNKPVGNLKQEK
jgi:ribosomal protein L29